VADHRWLLSTADELKIEATADAAVYKPGNDAASTPRDQCRGEGVRAALATMVDEAVFALAEKQPGFAKVFFYLSRSDEDAGRDPSIGMPEMVTTADATRDLAGGRCSQRPK